MGATTAGRAVGDAVGRPSRAGRATPAHRVADPRTWPWLPTASRGTLARHPWCTHCGAVRPVGGRPAMKLGGIVNLLARLEHVLEHHGHRVTEAQMRLILRKIHALGADDPFAMSHARQVATLADVAAQYLGLTSEVVESYLRSC